MEWLKKLKSSPYFKWVLLAVQMIIVAVAGFLGKDEWYVICISLIGLIFNLLVSYNISYGFLVGFVYAILNGVNAYYGKIYATFGFMIIMQAPMALYSFYSWQRNKSVGSIETTLKNMSLALTLAMVAGMVILGVGSYFLMLAVKSKDIIPDTIFFVFSVSACILLALRFKVAYIVTLLSGLGGTILFAVTGNISLSVFYAIVSINSIIGIVNNYKKKDEIFITAEQIDTDMATDSEQTDTATPIITEQIDTEGAKEIGGEKEISSLSVSEGNIHS